MALRLFVGGRPAHVCTDGQVTDTSHLICMAVPCNSPSGHTSGDLQACVPPRRYSAKTTTDRPCALTLPRTPHSHGPQRNVSVRQGCIPTSDSLFGHSSGNTPSESEVGFADFEGMADGQVIGGFLRKLCSACPGAVWVMTSLRTSSALVCSLIIDRWCSGQARCARSFALI